MAQSVASASTERRADIDSLRVAALALLIVYHVLLVFSTAWWRVKSDHASPWADYLISVLTPWRMALVFLIGGMAARFMMERSTTLAFIGERAGKLLTAFIFAVIVIIPLQRYVRLDNDGAPVTSYLDFLFLRARYAVNDMGVWLPDFANAWFLPYLFIYCALGVLLWRWAPRALAAAQRVVETTPVWLLAGAGMILFAFTEAVLLPRYPISGLLFPDITAHVRFFPIFLLGLLIGKSSVFTARLLAQRTSLWVTAALLLALSIGLQWLVTEGGGGALTTGWQVVRGFYGMAMLLSVLALGAYAFATPHPALTWASDAILPIYLLHQTVLVVAADTLTRSHLSLPLELLALISVTTLIPLALYVLFIRPTPWLRVLFGLRPSARAWKGSAPQAQAASLDDVPDPR